jgi:DNA-binding MarR family transcriptional regulator
VKSLHNEPAPFPPGVDGAFERLFELAARMGDSMGKGLTEYGLSTARAEVVWYLHRHGGATQRELSQALRCTPRNVTGLLDALEAAGLVSRGRHPTDRRATVVTLTDVGRDLAAGWQAGYRRAADRLFGDVADNDLATFVAVLDRVLDRLGDIDSV